MSDTLRDRLALAFQPEMDAIGASLRAVEAELTKPAPDLRRLTVLFGRHHEALTSGEAVVVRELGSSPTGASRIRPQDGGTGKTQPPQGN